MLMRCKDLTGQVFGRLTVLSRGENNPRNQATWVCQCECGGIVQTASSSLVSGNTKSCGCYRKDTAFGRKVRHGMTGKSPHPLYQVWSGIRHRCINTRSVHYKRYGARGIKVYAPWVNDPAAFIQYIEGLPDNDKRATHNYSLDRIDPNGNYEPGNLRWANKREQTLNKRPQVWAESPLGKAIEALGQVPEERLATLPQDIAAVIRELVSVNIQR